MALSDTIKEKVAIEVIRILVSRFDSFPEDDVTNRNAPFHDAFLNAFKDKIERKISDIPFSISFSSWMIGLNTTLGQTFFENIAHLLSNGEKREYTSKRLGNLMITKIQRRKITKILVDLSNTDAVPNLIFENNLIFANDNTATTKAMDFSADVFIEDVDTITAIELKSVKPNSGEMKGEKQKILEGKAALYRQYPGKQIHFYLGFPFDSTVDCEAEAVSSFDKTRFLSQIINVNKFFAPDETLIASELWNLLSGEENTMEQILEIINSISTTEFLTKYQYLKENDNRTNQRYKDILLEWYLISELELVENNATIKDKIGTERRLNRIYNKSAFDRDNKYDWNRYHELKELI